MVVYLPLWKIWVRQLEWLFPIYGKIKKSCSKPQTSHCIPFWMASPCFSTSKYQRLASDMDMKRFWSWPWWLELTWGWLEIACPYGRFIDIYILHIWNTFHGLSWITHAFLFMAWHLMTLDSDIFWHFRPSHPSPIFCRLCHICGT